MAVTATTVWEIRTTGNDLNSGAFDPSQSGAGTDYSQQDAAQLTLTDLACTSASTTLTSATGGFTAAMIGNYIQVSSGTNALAGNYRITARTDTNTVTIDRTCATGGNMTAGVGSVGGALASPGKAFGLATTTTGQNYWIKSGTYSITSTTPNVAGGICRFPAAGIGQADLSQLRAYQTTRGDRGARAVLQASGIASVTLLSGNAKSYWMTDGVEADGADLVAIKGMDFTGSYNFTVNCVASRCLDTGISSSGAASHVIDSEVYDCSGGSGAFAITGQGAQAVNCNSHDNNASQIGLAFGTYTTAIYCVSHDNDSTGIQCGQAAYHCTSYSNTGDGFTLGNGQLCMNCHAEDNGGWGFGSGASTESGTVIGCTTYNNTSGGVRTANLVNASLVRSNTAASAACMVDPANNDFDLNATAGGGAAVTGAGYPQSLPGAASTTPKPTPGYSQPAAATGGGGGPVSIRQVTGGYHYATGV